MPEKWTGNLIGRMHNANISQDELAEELGVSPAYVSMILNGRRMPDGAKKRLEEAFQSVSAKKNGLRGNKRI